MNTNSKVTNLETQLTKILHQAAAKLKLEKYSIHVNLNVNKSDGFLGELYKVSILDDETNTTHYLVIKKAPSDKRRREQQPVEQIYKNEIFFYSKICPTFRRFEEEYKVNEFFESVPKYITCSVEIGNEMIVLNDITKEGYIMRKKDLVLDDEHVRLIFKTYGHFHAISFCLKKQKPDEFEQLTKSLPNHWREICNQNSFTSIMGGMLEKAYEALDPNVDKHVMEKFEKYKDSTKEMFEKSCEYTGSYCGILHGDCWSNNMMFKYQGSQNLRLESVKLLDFQLVTCSSPVNDLSYFFYTGGSKVLFDKLEEYLDVYHNSFSKVAKKFGCDADELLPRDALTEDWRKYAKFGMMLASVLIKFAMKCNADTFKTRIRDILIHMYEIDAL